jgi:hypothetical protein
VAVVFSVAVSLTVCALHDVAFVHRQLKFNFALLEVFHIVNVLILRGGFEFDQEHEKWKSGLSSFDVPNIWDCVS